MFGRSFKNTLEKNASIDTEEALKNIENLVKGITDFDQSDPENLPNGSIDIHGEIIDTTVERGQQQKPR